MVYFYIDPSDYSELLKIPYIGVYEFSVKNRKISQVNFNVKIFLNVFDNA